MLAAVGNCSNTNVHNQVDTQPNSNPYNQKQSCRRCSVCAASLIVASIRQRQCARSNASDYRLPQIKRRTQTGGVCEHGAEENIGT